MTSPDTSYNYLNIGQKLEIFEGRIKPIAARTTLNSDRAKIKLHELKPRSTSQE